MTVLQETADYVIILKPVGILSQGAPAGGEDLITRLSAHYGNPVYPVHRLDRGTGGVMVYAKTPKAAATLSAAIARGEMEKEYLAVVHGICEPQGSMTDLLFHRSAGNKSFVVDRMRAGVKEARLTYRRIATLTVPEPLSLVRVHLETGRTHQIRVQFAHRAHPLYGDGKYGAHSPGEPRLFCAKIAFPDPRTGRTVTAIAEPEGEIWTRFPRKTQENTF